MRTDRPAPEGLFAHSHGAGHRPPDGAGPHRPPGAPAGGADFEPDRARLSLGYRILSGRAGQLVAFDTSPTGRAVPPDADALYLPSHPPADPHHGLAGREWYRVAVVHRALHHLLGSFAIPGDEPADDETRHRPPLLRFTARFGSPALALKIFLTLEDLRVDAAARRLLPGLAESYRLACHQELHERPPLTMLPARDALAEALVQFSIGADGVVAPRDLDPALARAVPAARALLDPRATVGATLAATIRVYDLVLGLPERAAYRSGRAVRFDEFAGDAEQAPGSPSRAAAGPVTFYPVAFRDFVGESGGAPDPESRLPVTQPVEWLDASTAPGPDGPDGPRRRRSQLRHPPGATEPAPAEGARPAAVSRPVIGPLVPAAGVAVARRLVPTGPHEYVYPEWDGVAGRYLDGHCLVKVARAPLARSQHRLRAARARHAGLLPDLVAALERLQPAGRDVVRRQRHGADVDLDAAIEAMIDLRSGVVPDDRVYTDTQQRRRDVAVAFALDLSASTAEALPPDPADPGADVTRAIDVEREAVSLLIQALERVGDAYGIYGFSGAGRDDVRLSVVKDLTERRTTRTMLRLEGLTPDRNTRIGAAVRFLTEQLTRTDAASKVLFVLSDGRPYDLDYGQQYGEEVSIPYALADTGRALDEARRSNVTPYLVTIDADEADYLSYVSDPHEYHAIGDARELPGALAELYVAARASAVRGVAAGNLR